MSKTLNKQGALNGVIGRLAGNYGEVPVIGGIEGAPTIDDLRHFGAAMANFGSIALFHIVGVTPEAPVLQDVGGDRLFVRHRIDCKQIEELAVSYAVSKQVDMVVFSAPQLSIYELRQLAQMCDGSCFTVPLLAVTSPQVTLDFERFGYMRRSETADGTVLLGMCFYQSYAREVVEAEGWKTPATDSAKLLNISGGYGDTSMLASAQDCVEAVEKGELA